MDSISVTESVWLYGNALTVRGLSRFGCTLTVTEYLIAGSGLSAVGSVHLQATMTVTGISSFESSLSVFRDVDIGSRLRVVEVVRLGKSGSVRGYALPNGMKKHGETNKRLALSSGLVHWRREVG